MNRWDIVREKRNDIERMQREYQRKQMRKFWWIRQARTVQALKAIYDLFDQTKTAIYNGYKEKLLAKRIVRKFGHYAAKRAPTFEERMLNQIRYTKNGCIHFMKDI